MATFTTNYNLRKPAGSDFVTVASDINASMDILDSEIKEREDEVVALDARTDTLEELAIPNDGSGLWTDFSGDLTMAANWTCTIALYWRLGPIVAVYCKFGYSGSTVTVGATSNITDINVVASGWPAEILPTDNDQHLSTDRVALSFWRYRIKNTGALDVTHSPSGSTLDNGHTHTLKDIYFLGIGA